METISHRIYTVRTAFSAIHAILYHSVPENQTFRQYLTFFLLLAKLLHHSWRSYFQTCSDEFNPKIALLICQNSLTRKSRAFIGFSAIGLGLLKDLIFEDRRRNLPVLRSITTQLPWDPANCAEAETFAHLQLTAERIGSTFCPTIAASLTVDLKTLKPCRHCPNCKKVSKSFQSQTLVTLDLAPFDRRQDYDEGGIFRTRHN
jgi:hypothetical protein